MYLHHIIAVRHADILGDFKIIERNVERDRVYATIKYYESMGYTAFEHGLVHVPAQFRKA